MPSDQIKVLQGDEAMSSQEKEKENQKPKNKINKTNTIPEECTLYNSFQKRSKNQKQNKKKAWMLMEKEKRNCMPLGRTILFI